MSNLYEIGSRIQATKSKVFSAIVCGSLVVTSGCGIPNHRGALPGPQMPQFYSWTSGVLSRKQELAHENSNDEIEAESTTTSEETANEIIQLTNYAPTPTEALVEESEIGEEALHAFIPPPVEDDEPEVLVFENSAYIPTSVFFDDHHLLTLIHQALAGNQELRILAEEIQIANNEVEARSGEYLPFVTLGGGAGLENPSRYSRAGAVEEQLEIAPGRRFPEPLPDFLAAANISWELDVWHKLRNAEDAAAMRYLGSAEGRCYIVTRLVAEVAENYYELLSLDSRLVTLEKTIEIQEKSLEIAESKKEAGRGTELAVQRFQAEVRKNQSERLIIQQEIIEVENRINFLLGRYPQPIDRPSVEFVDLNLYALDAGLPSELLRNRADIRQAEREVAAAGLDVKVARARFYPSFGLNAGIGLNTYNMRYLFSTPESLIYNATVDLEAVLPC